MKGRISATNAPAIAAIRLGITEGDAAGRIEMSGLEQVRDGMRHWYDRDRFEAWLAGQPELATTGA